MGSQQSISVTFKITEFGNITVLDNFSWPDANPRIINDDLSVTATIPSWFGSPDNTIIACDPSTKLSFIIKRNISSSSVTASFLSLSSVAVDITRFSKISDVVKEVGIDEGSQRVMKMTISLTRPPTTVSTLAIGSVYYYIDSMNSPNALNTNVTNDGILDYNFKRLERAIRPREQAITSPGYLDVNVNTVNFNVANKQYVLLLTIKQDLSVTYDNFYAPIVGNVYYNEARNSIIIRTSNSSSKFTSLVNVISSGIGVPTTLTGIISMLDSNMYELKLYMSGSIVNISNADNLGQRVVIPDLVKNGPLELSLLVL